jgi:hypothetical protein
VLELSQTRLRRALLAVTKNTYRVFRSRLVVGLLQRRESEWLTLDCRCPPGDGRRYIVQSDELLSAFLELEATLL